MQAGPLDGIGRFSYEIIRRLAANNPNDRFSLLFDRKFDPSFLFDKNVSGMAVPPPTRLPMLMDIFFEFSLPHTFKKIKPDVFFSPDGWVSMKSKIPTVSVVHDLNFVHMPEHLPPMWKKYYEKKFPGFIRRADHLITVSEFSKQDIIQQFNIAPENISVVYNDTAEGFRPAKDLDEIKQIRNKHSAGKPFFFFVGLIHPRKNIDGLMEAFRIYKERSASETRLLIAGSKKWWNAEMEAKHQNNPFRDEIIFTGKIPDETLKELYRASEALVYPSFFEGFGIPILEAFKSGVPVITSNTTAMPEVGGDAALYANPQDAESFALQMLALADPALRRNCIEKGFQQCRLFNWDRGAETVRNILHRYANPNS